jgi:hypothetical protein
MPASRSRSGAGKAGSIPKIRGAGFNGTAAITWGGASRRRTHARLNDGRPSGDTSHRSSGTANLAIRNVGRGSAKLCCTGPTTAARFETKPSSLLTAQSGHPSCAHECPLFGGKSGHGDEQPECLLLTQSGHLTANILKISTSLTLAVAE